MGTDTHTPETRPDPAAVEYYRRQELEQDEAVGAEAAMLEQYREQARESMAEFRERFITPLAELHMLPTDCLIFANGYGHVIDCYCQKDIVERHRQAPNAKANVSKYVKQYTRRQNLPALSGQRDEAACQRMREARNEQLETKNQP